jgi:hypothetical protein
MKTPGKAISMSRIELKKLNSLICLLVLFCSLFLSVQTARSAVVFEDFTATSDGQDVDLEWSTSSEVDNEGFYVTQSDRQTGTYDRISELLDATGDAENGDFYLYTDADLSAGTYWYRIEAVDASGTVQTTDPVSVTVSDQATATTGSGATSTHAPTATTSSGYPAPETLSPEVYYTPTRRTYPGAATAPPAAATAIPTASPTLQLSQPPTFSPSTQEGTTSTEAATMTPPSFTGNETEVATLIPLPPITMIFPEEKQASMLITATPNATVETGSCATPQRIIPLALILLIWVILGVWFYYSQRTLG